MVFEEGAALAARQGRQVALMEKLPGFAANWANDEPAKAAEWVSNLPGAASSELYP